MNVWDVMIGAAVIAALALALRSVIRNRKKGGCGCGCADCPMSGSCAGKDPGQKPPRA